MAEYGSWYEYVIDFSHIVHTRYGFYTAYPFSGGYYDQPYRTMQIFDILMNVFRDVLKEQSK